MNRLEDELDNLRAAIAWTEMDENGAEPGLRLVGALHWFWYVHGYWTEAARSLEEALARDNDVPPSAFTNAALGAAHFAMRFNDYKRATALSERGLAVCRELGDSEKAGAFLLNLGVVAVFENDDGRAWTLFDDAVLLFRVVGHKWGIGLGVTQLGMTALRLGDLDRSLAYLQEGLALSREVGDEWLIAYSLRLLGHVALHQGDYTRAATLYTESLGFCNAIAGRWVAEGCLEGLATVASAEGCFERAARLFGTAEAIRKALGRALNTAEQTVHDERVAAARAGRYEEDVSAARVGLGEVAFGLAWAEGRAMTLEQAIDYALAPEVGAEDTAKPTAINQAARALTPREREVAALIAQGLTNRQIASRLVITERTAESHVQHILDKLEFNSRARIAVWAIEQRLYNSAQT